MTDGLHFTIIILPPTGKSPESFAYHNSYLIATTARIIMNYASSLSIKISLSPPSYSPLHPILSFSFTHTLSPSPPYRGLSSASSPHLVPTHLSSFGLPGEFFPSLSTFSFFDQPTLHWEPGGKSSVHLYGSWLWRWGGERRKREIRIKNLLLSYRFLTYKRKPGSQTIKSSKQIFSSYGYMQTSVDDRSNLLLVVWAWLISLTKLYSVKARFREY